MTLVSPSIADLQASVPDVRLALDEAGVSQLVRGVLLPGGIAATVEVDLAVGVSAHVRGVHMSRFHEALDAAVEACGVDPARPARLGNDASLSAIGELALHAAREACQRQGSDHGRARVCARVALPTQAPASGRTTRDPITIRSEAVVAAGGTAARRTMEVEVTGMTACPCAQQLVQRASRDRLSTAGVSDEDIDQVFAHVPVATHNQRGTATVAIETASAVDPLLLAQVAWESMSARTHELLKREDELHVVEAAHARPRFVEDCVREAARNLLDRPFALDDSDRIAVRQVNHESIHAHDVHATLAGTVAELREQLAP